MKRKLLYALLGLATIVFGVLFIVEEASESNKPVLPFIPLTIGVGFLIFGLIKVLHEKKKLNSNSILGIIVLAVGAAGIVLSLIDLIKVYNGKSTEMQFTLYVIAILLILLSDFRFYKKPEGIFEFLLPALMQAAGILILCTKKDGEDMLFYILGAVLIIEGGIEIYYAFAKEHIRVKTEMTAKMDIVDEEKPAEKVKIKEVKALENTPEGIEEKKEDLE